MVHVWRTGHDAELVHRHSVTDATAAEPSAEVGVAVGVEEREAKRGVAEGGEGARQAGAVVPRSERVGGGRGRS